MSSFTLVPPAGAEIESNTGAACNEITDRAYKGVCQIRDMNKIADARSVPLDNPI
jgi:NMD protein affecting ribosome stability and mRNA decay